MERKLQGGFLFSLAARSLQVPDDQLGGNSPIHGVLYPPGDIGLNGGGNATDVTGGILAGQAVDIEGNHDTVTSDATRTRRAGGASGSPSPGPSGTRPPGCRAGGPEPPRTLSPVPPASRPRFGRSSGQYSLGRHISLDSIFGL